MRFIQKAMLKIFFCLCTIILSIAFCSVIVPKASKLDVMPENHFVIMYDISESMKDADYRLQGMVADFLYRVPAEQYPYKIAIIPFASQCPETDILQNGDVDWWEIQTENGETKERIKDMLANLEYTGKYTDIEGALRKCAHVLKEMKSSGKACNQTVLFITDGVVDLPGDETNIDCSRIDNIIESAKRIPKIAEDFPNECRFWAIVPDDIAENAIITYDGDNIVSYYGIAVKAYQQKGIRATLTCMDDFCHQLNMLQTEGKKERAKTIPMDWTANTLQNFKAAYNEFFESIWDTSMIVKNHVVLENGQFFCLPNGITEVAITIMPEAENEEQCKEVVDRLISDGTLSVTADDFELDITPEASIYTINIKLKNPSSGIYQIKSAVKELCTFTLDFLAYSNLALEIPERNNTYALGTTILLKGSIVDSEGTAISEETASHLMLEAIEETKPNENSVEAASTERIEKVELVNDRFQYDFTLNHVGSNHLRFRINYDDTNDRQIPDGITKFTKEEVVIIEVPEVSYAEEVRQHFFAEPDYVLQPYSEISGAQVNVSAEAAKEYLKDDWVLRLFDKQGVQIGTDAPLQISEDGDFFILRCENKHAKSAVIFNRSSNESIDIEVPSFVRKGYILVFLLVFSLIAGVVIIAILLKSRKITVEIYGGGQSVKVDVKKDGYIETSKLAGEELTVEYERTNNQIIVEWNGQRAAATVIGHRCRIDF